MKKYAIADKNELYDEYTSKNDKNYIKPEMFKNYEFGKIFSFDTEALKVVDEKGIEHQYLANFSFYDGHTNYSGFTKDEMYNYLKQFSDEYSIITVICHNWKYDVKVSNMFYNLIHGFDGTALKDFTVDKLLIDSIFFVKIKGNNKIINLLDTTNYFRGIKVSDMAQSLGMKKTFTDMEYKITDNDLWNDLVRKNGIEMSNKDTMILYEYFMKFMGMKDIVHGISISHTAFNTYNRYYQHDLIVYPHLLDNIVKSLYRGARTEVYVKKDYVYNWVYDVNSLYPSVMYNNNYSYNFINKPNLKIKDIDSDFINDSNYNFVFKCNIEFDKKYTRLPLMVRIKDKLTQKYSVIEQWITGREYLECLNYGNVDIKDFYMFKSKKLFKEYVDYFYKLRQSSKDYKDFYKLMLNSLYGKFGQHVISTEIVPFEELDKDFVNLIKTLKMERIKINDITYSIYNGFVSKLTDMGVKYNPIISAEITGDARLHNFKLQKQLGFKHVYYTDTDSFFIDYKLTDKSLVNNELGNLKLEKEGYFKFNGAKDYEWLIDNNKHYKIKGISKKAIKINDNEYEYFVFDKLKSKNIDNVAVKKIRKKLKHVDNKLRYVNGIGIPYA